MTEPIASKEFIACNADAAALRQIETGVIQPNPWPAGTAAYAEWRAVFEHQLRWYGSQEVERSA